MIKPKRLEPGLTIGIVSPSYWLDKDKLNKTIKYYRGLGYRIKIGSSNNLREGPFSGSPLARASDINNMFADPNINAILCTRGGYGANRLLQLLDYELIRKNPKIFIGFSDITALLLSITQKTNLITFHGPMLISNENRFINYNHRTMVQVLGGSKQKKILAPNKSPAKILNPGIGTGKLWGGNITLIINRIGTIDQLDTHNAILFLEDVDEYIYSFERMLIHLQTAGVFENIKGLIIGELHNFKDQEIPFNKNTDEIVMDICGHLDIPIITNYPCGHGEYQCTLPLSIPVELNAMDKKPYIRFTENAVL